MAELRSHLKTYGDVPKTQLSELELKVGLPRINLQSEVIGLDI